jgi:hypothetical protein
LMSWKRAAGHTHTHTHILFLFLFLFLIPKLHGLEYTDLHLTPLEPVPGMWVFRFREHIKLGELPWHNGLGFFCWGRSLKIHFEIKRELFTKLKNINF